MHTPEPSPTGNDPAYAQTMALRRDQALRRRLMWCCIAAIGLMFIAVFGFALELLGMPIDAGRRAANTPDQLNPGSAVLFVSSTALLLMFTSGLVYTARTRLTAPGPAAGDAPASGRHRLVVALTWLTVGATAVGAPAEIIAQWVNLNHGPADAVARVYQEPDRAGWTATNVYGIFFLLACVMVPMRWAESLRIALPGLAVLVAAVGLLLYPPLNLAIALAALACAYTVAGSAWSAWRYTDFEARLRAHALGSRYSDLRGQVQEISAELRDARRLHESLFPPAQPDGCAVRIEYRYQPARQIGGDFLYIHREPHGDALTVAVIDVSGHGVAAALAVNRLHGELQRFFSHYPAVQREAGGPGHLLSNLNTYACAALAPQGMYATAMVVRTDPRVRGLEWASAGHPSAFLLAAAGPVELDSTATMLGVLPPDLFDADQRSTTINPGEAVIVYTDGAVESRDQHGADYTSQRLRDAAARAAAPRLDTLLADIERHRHGRISDDTLLVELTLVHAPAGATIVPDPAATAAQTPYTQPGVASRTPQGADHGSI